MDRSTTHLETLEEQANHAIAEARMVLPGVQALLGFQLVAVFNQRFRELSHGDQVTHIAGFLLIALAAGLLMTPAAYHRQTGCEKITRHFVKLATWLIMTAMWPLAVGIALDTYLLGRLVFEDRLFSIAMASGVLFMLVGLWFAFPMVVRARLEGP
jgi:cation transporter-like permease